MNPLETYLKGMAQKRSFRGGDPETTYYGVLERLFDEIGKSLKPKVQCLISLENRGALARSQHVGAQGGLGLHQQQLPLGAQVTASPLTCWPARLMIAK